MPKTNYLDATALLARRRLIKSIVLGFGYAASPLLAKTIDLAFERPVSKGITLSDRGRDVLYSLCDCIIPPTDTPGAVESGVAEFVESVVTDLFSKKMVLQFESALVGLNDFCKSKIETLFNSAPFDMKVLAIQHLIERDPEIFYAIREAVVVGYFTSFKGATIALQYNPMPLHFDGKVKLSDAPKQWSY